MLAKEWNSAYIMSARKLKIVEGFKDNTYKPYQDSTRAEAIKMMSIISGIKKAPESCEKQPFVDVDAKHWVSGIARDAFCSGITAGKTIGGKRYLLPDEPITREEMAVLIYNFYVSNTQ